MAGFWSKLFGGGRSREMTAEAEFPVIDWDFRRSQLLEAAGPMFDLGDAQGRAAHGESWIPIDRAIAGPMFVEFAEALWQQANTDNRTFDLLGAAASFGPVIYQAQLMAMAEKDAEFEGDGQADSDR